MSKRNKLDIVLDMLNAIQKKQGKIKPTHLMYKSNLAHRQLKSYLEELIEKNLVEKIKNKKNDYIIITDEGSKFLEKIREAKEFERTFGF